MSSESDAESAIRRRTVLGMVGAVGAGALAGCLSDDEESDGSGDGPAAYEIWALDQGTDVGYIYEPADDGFEQADSIDFAAAVHDHEDGHGDDHHGDGHDHEDDHHGDHDDDHHEDDHDDHDHGDNGHEDDHDHDDGGLAPHMIDFSSDFEYAVVALHHGDGIAVVRTEDRELVGTVSTGIHSHFAAFSPDDEYITVDHVDDNRVVKVDVDLDAEEFEIVDEIVLTQEAGDAFEGRDPTCHYYTGTGYTYHTLGPSYHDAGLAIIDHEAFELVEAYTGDEVGANCGVMPHPEQEVVYLTAGLPSDPDEGVEGVSEYFVMDANDHEVLVNEDTRGIDAHGLWVTPDSEEVWIVNRETNDGVVLDAETHEIDEEVDEFGPAPGEAPEESDAIDILATSPDGEYLFVTTRGPNPVTADPQAATGVNPGFVVMDVDNRERVEVVQPTPDDPDSDFHGLGIRPLEDVDGYVAPPY